jgi:hypothetical protein
VDLVETLAQVKVFFKYKTLFFALRPLFSRMNSCHKIIPLSIFYEKSLLRRVAQKAFWFFELGY